MISNIKQFAEFIRSYATGGVILIACVVISLVIANTGLHTPFTHFLNTPIGPYSRITWINDGLMAIFFLLVGLEIKDEVLNGELSDRQSATLPVFAAIGGMLVPAGIYALINFHTNTSAGWGIPMATDIAFVVAIISVIKSRVPQSLQVFIKALAIVDDLGAILVIAIFYSAGLHTTYLLLALAMFVLQLLLNKFNVRYLLAYLIPGAFMWYFIHHSGIHATVTGVLTAMAIPHNVKVNYSPLKKLIQLLENPVNFIIIPIFALANSNINIGESLAGGNIINPLSAGILLGLILGKPIGITLFSWLAVKLKLSKLADGVKWMQVWGIGQLAGIGFTMSIFMALLSFADVGLQSQAKFIVLVTSVLAAAVGYTILLKIKKK
ncbi:MULTISPECIES: Na+/H+ antiporter NhaA [unclassified Mucilaginibacter]|uniref:Na+/H+ antiporter NhaA n=1 Tax=unclassified Mucilaginibacter TaxID=2617802 RepID=UPI002AC8D67C|nr:MULTISPECIES: Na+/H+ antiporter NhaA [unclassified Mucilaginibacter]MEB0262469.1 Na+/H+ antiporter NhaA [Mucilaginibacter sp. 10I4]MEB0279909.1 Na+/H+ antiporter NhaA [Mucilaginibacter sp. 10B2]MEB0300055.1 Na+/H+ antiporter NhaA [Mucilaginibacter sp. 5C4]WPX21867.1 Na+/H+ antiporter NhaA [Mucilaginibacter sp. 5C4]